MTTLTPSFPNTPLEQIDWLTARYKERIERKGKDILRDIKQESFNAGHMSDHAEVVLGTVITIQRLERCRKTIFGACDPVELPCGCTGSPDCLQETVDFQCQWLTGLIPLASGTRQKRR